MSSLLHKLILLIWLLSFPVASAQEKKVPKLLFLGDSVHRQIVEGAGGQLGGQVSLHFPPGASPYDSGTALAKIDSLLGEAQWDIIYFNFGIGDLFYKDPATKEIRVMCKSNGGVRVSTPAQYEKQLDGLVQRLKATKARLIWGNTTPLITISAWAQPLRDRLFDAKSEIEYNAIAARVMAKHNVPVVDLHSHVMEQFKPDEAHPHYSLYAGVMAKKGQPLPAPLVQALKAVASEIR